MIRTTPILKWSCTMVKQSFWISFPSMFWVDSTRRRLLSITWRGALFYWWGHSTIQLSIRFHGCSTPLRSLKSIVHGRGNSLSLLPLSFHSVVLWSSNTSNTLFKFANWVWNCWRFHYVSYSSYFHKCHIPTFIYTTGSLVGWLVCTATSKPGGQEQPWRGIGVCTWTASPSMVAIHCKPATMPSILAGIRIAPSSNALCTLRSDRTTKRIRSTMSLTSWIGATAQADLVDLVVLYCNCIML